MKKLEEEMPVELKLELLVDAELPEEERRELLLALDREPGRWRELSLRFLERQMEKQAAREWIGAAPVAAAVAEEPKNYSFPTASIASRYYLRPIAAGLLVAAVSAVVTVYAVRQPRTVVDPLVMRTGGPMVTNIPGDVLDYPQSVRMDIPVANLRNVDQPFFPPTQAQSGNDFGAKRSVVIQADAMGNPVAIPVNPLRMRFY